MLARKRYQARSSSLSSPVPVLEGHQSFGGTAPNGARFSLSESGYTPKRSREGLGLERRLAGTTGAERDGRGGDFSGHRPVQLHGIAIALGRELLPRSKP